LFQSATSLSQVVDNALVGKVFCGYQAWFNAKGDGSPIDSWRHWGGNPPSPGNLSFEVYPDVSDYAASSLFQTGFADLGDGQPSKLFSSYKENVIDVHCSWMQEHGIDGVALQRFLGPVLSSNSIKANRDSVAVRLKRASEKYGTLYYLMYDMAPDNVAGFKSDMEHMEDDLLFMDSPNYAHQNGKPVICLWGIGFDHRDGSGYNVNSQILIDWLHAKGYYVIGGVPSRWRFTNGEGDVAPGYEDVFASMDMISPWTPGRYRHVEGADEWKNDFLVPDKAKCDALGIDYQPVVFSGFAWSNWNGGSANAYPRHKGEFLWAQVENISSLGIPSMYVAMFDEYDEGTNIMKMADSYLGIPGDQYFLTSSADGSYISSDFYLRLVGKATRVLKGEDPLTPNVSIPFSEGPMYFRTSHEPGYDALPDWKDTADEPGPVNVDGLGCAHVQEHPHVGAYSLKFTGMDNSTAASSATMKVFDVDIPVFEDSKLMFWSRPDNALSRHATVDLILTDGSTLSSSGATDVQGQPMLPSAGRGAVGEWTKSICRIGHFLDTTAGGRDTIDKIVISYAHAGETGEVRALFDDISIYRLDTDEVQMDNASMEPPVLDTQMDPGETRTVNITALNTGTSSWTAEKGYKLASQTPPDNLIWGLNRVELGTDSIPPGEKKTFTFDITAPDSLGKYNFQWQMIREIAGEEPIRIGESSENVVVTVGDVAGTNFAEIYEGLITRRAEIHEGEGAEKAFDLLYKDGEKNVDWSKWLDNGGIPSVSDPCWIQIEFPDSVAVDLLTIVSGNDYPARDPEDFALLASNDGSAWTVLGSWVGQAWSSRFEEKLLPVDNAEAYRFYRLETTKNKGDNTMTQLCEIKLIQVGVFLTLPEKATNPNPPDAAANVAVSSGLSWSPGRGGDSQEVYFGTSNPPPFLASLTDSVFDPGILEHSTTYYWRINGKNGDGTGVGDLWSFTTEMAFSDAAFLSQDLPGDTLDAGSSVTANVVMRNTGESTWNASEGFVLASPHPEEQGTWGLTQVMLGPDEKVLPGEEKTFAFLIRAPSQTGDYTFQWQMRNREGWFGDVSELTVLRVEKPLGLAPDKMAMQVDISNPGNGGLIRILADNLQQDLLISVVSLDGKTIYQGLSDGRETEIKLKDHLRGIYVVKAGNKYRSGRALILIR